MIESRREQLFTGAVIALLLLAAALDARITVIVAVALLAVGVVFLRDRVRGLVGATVAGAVAIALVAIVRVLR